MSARAGDPAALDRGLTIQPGQIVSCNMEGIHHTTGQNTPGMNATIQVTIDNGD